MTTTAKQSSSSNVRNAANFTEGEEDIAQIAKQISDHAEAIYQTWKARGLAPTEILNCHTDPSSAFSKTLSPTSPQPGGTQSASSTSQRSKESPVAELLAQAPDLSNNNLEKLVSSFVNEDKARIAAQKRGAPGLGSGTIKFALQKFENNGTDSSRSPSTPTKPNFLRQNSNPPSGKSNVPDVLKDVQQQQQQPQQPAREKPQTPVKPEHLLNHVPTWPLKNRLGTSPQQMRGNKESSPPKDGGVGVTTTNINTSSRNPSDLMDEVSREEERLINALKTGTVLANDKSLPEVITSTLNDTTDHIGYAQPDVSTNDIKYVPDDENADALTNGNNNNNNVNNNNLVQKHWNGVPMKPNHTPILLAHSKDDSRFMTNFTRVATTRLPSRQETQTLDDKKNFHVKTIASPIRPFLSRGSVAERVLIFEKAPPEKTPARTTTKEAKPQPKPQSNIAKLFPQSHTTLQRHLKSSAKNIYIPQFYFPNGKPPPAITTETTMQRLEQTFSKFSNFEVSREKFHLVVSMCQVPLYWRVPLFMCTPLTPNGCVDGNKFIDFWRKMTKICHDSASRFVHILSKGDKSRPYILPEDLAPLIQDVVDTHPGLAFLKEAAEFHSRYVHTVIARIFYNVNRSWSGRIYVPELRKSNLMEVILLLEEEEDINQIMAYFSYEHFYVIYCKFWELDRDHDLYIDQKDLARHNDHALSSRMIERIFSGCVTRGSRARNAVPTGPNGPKMSYTEFVWFLLAEEDKSHPTAIEYWFRCMDIDGDGILSMYELEYFYEEQQQRMESIGIETLPFEDCLCQMLDMIKPTVPGCVTLSDLKRCRMTSIFFDTFFNLEKYMEHEQRDPFAQREADDLSDWDRYAAQEYELLVAEEGGDTQGSYDEEDEYESNIDILESQIDDCIVNECENGETEPRRERESYRAKYVRRRRRRRKQKEEQEKEEEEEDDDDDEEENN